MISRIVFFLVAIVVILVIVFGAVALGNWLIDVIGGGRWSSFLY